MAIFDARATRIDVYVSDKERRICLEACGEENHEKDVLDAEKLLAGLFDMDGNLEAFMLYTTLNTAVLLLGTKPVRLISEDENVQDAASFS